MIDGKAEAVRLALTVLLAEGHLLIEDVPGVGKTMLAKALARSIDCSVRRVQFTPDLLPSDITGVSAYNQDLREFEFKPGPVFANIVVGDEINRASPKTQSALLECMEERQVTVDGTTHQLQPPVHGHRHAEPGGDGGHLPAARSAAGPVHRPHLDRVPDGGGRAGDARHPWLVISPGPAQASRHGATGVRDLISAVRGVLVTDQVKQYIIVLANATRKAPELRLGASPRAALHLLRASRARAALQGRDYVIPDDVQALAVPVLAHRLLPTTEAIYDGRLPEQVVARLVADLPLPRP